VYPDSVAGQKVLLSPGVVIGRSPEDDVKCVFHPTISRRHARIVVGAGGVPCLEDLGSRNSTQVNGRKVERVAPLARQSVVRLGEVLGVIDEPTEERFDGDAVLPGTSPLIAAARADLARMAKDPAPVLVTGETGTGKERVAKALHARSGRQGAFLALNCAELSPQLIESQLFGHERGAFTGADRAHPGLFVAASDGTLFLDELGELPLELQPKLLRVLQEGEVRPVGGLQTRRVDVRVVAATHQDLASWVDEGRFRRDLYARLALWELRLPPLRERRQDIFHWLSALQVAWNDERGTSSTVALGIDAAERILLHAWPDNLRGLNRLVHRLASSAEDKPIGLRALQAAAPELFVSEGQSTAPPPPEDRGSSFPPGQGVGIVRPTREEFLAVYNAAGQNVTATSKYYGKDRRQIYRWLASFGIPRGPEED
jgi:DNA-binding NtrC family response regulator